MTSVVLTCALLIGLLTSCVVASLAIEGWAGRRARRRTVPAPQPEFEAEDTIEREPVTGDQAGEGLALESDEGPSAVRSEELVVIDGRDRMDQLVGVLFASYVAAGMSESKRVAAWVTADRQADRDGREFVPGADLRGRTAAVTRLLALDQDERCWVTLNDRVDIARGLAARPPTCEVLLGLTTFWAATRSAMSLLDDADLRAITCSMTDLEPHWGSCPAAGDVRRFYDRLVLAGASSGPVRLQVKLASYGAVPDERVDGSSSSPHMSPPVPTQTV